VEDDDEGLNGACCTLRIGEMGGVDGSGGWYDSALTGMRSRESKEDESYDREVRGEEGGG
jgi:hypothetical protein